MSAPRIAITGPDGFVAWHMRCAARARWGGDLIGIGPEQFDDPALMDAALCQSRCCDPPGGCQPCRTTREIERVNPWLADAVGRVDAADWAADPRRLRQLDPRAGRLGVRGLQARARPRSCGTASRGSVDVVMPNIFGEHGVPNYNSVVATFCHALARGETPTVRGRQELPLVHVRRGGRPAAGSGASPPTPVRSRFPAGPRWVSEVAERSDHDRRGLPDRAAAGPVRPVHQGPLQHLPLGDVPVALPDPPDAGRRPARPAGRGGQGRGRAVPGLLLHHEPGLHPRAALAPAQGGAVPGAVRVRARSGCAGCSPTRW